eukprot:COSAG01_NODE_1316_length_10755_cov_4.749343_4_plen_53_part_00
MPAWYQLLRRLSQLERTPLEHQWQGSGTTEIRTHAFICENFGWGTQTKQICC